MRLSPLLLALLAAGCEQDTGPFFPGTGGKDETGETGEADLDGDGRVGAADCDEGDPDIYAGAEELCDEIDNDCDGGVDEDAGDPWYYDADGDGYGSDDSEVIACDRPENFIATGGDCDDTESAVNPGADEICDELDNDCDGLIDTADGTLTGSELLYEDKDGDGYGDDATAGYYCEGDGYVDQGGDCADADDDYHPGAAESDCEDPNDYNCDGSVGYADADGDGFAACVDCDDTSALTNDDADEVCDGADNDCDGETDEDPTDGSTWYYDADGDGYGDDATSFDGCDPGSGWTLVNGDCDDTDAAFNPAASESDCTDPNDYNCDGSVAYEDADGDGFAACEDCDDAEPLAYTGATEVCDGADNDCDGTVDNGDDRVTVYTDGDGDGYGDDATATLACDAASGESLKGGDCDDADAAFNPGASEADCSDPNDYNCDGSSGYADADGDGYAACEECDEADASVNPGATEACDTIDNDCDGEVDEADSSDAGSWYTDADGDGYGDDATAVTQCDGTGLVAVGGDCDDADAAFNPGATESDCTDPNDYDCDGSTAYADDDGDGYAACEECDDTSNDSYPGATEVCDGVDNDCDGSTDGTDAADAATWYLDTDGDGYGDDASTTVACDQPSGYAEYGGDCDDADARYHPDAAETDCTDKNDYNCDGSTGYSDADGDGFAACLECDDSDIDTYPGAPEVCDDKDNDCNLSIDDDATDATTWYDDDDNDGYGDGDSATVDCDRPSAGSVTVGGDCDDSDASVNGGEVEVCDNVDNDCDGTVDDGFDADGDGISDCYDTELCDGLDNDGDGEIDEDAEDADTWYTDVDADGYGDDATATLSCDVVFGASRTGGDCDDTDADVNPGESETCNNVDDDCDGAVDNDPTDGTTYYTDADGDGYGDATSTVQGCTAPSGAVSDGTDCDDGDSSIHPGATEVCDASDTDEDCNGKADDDDTSPGGTSTFYQDADGDGYGVSTSTTTACDAPSGYAALSTDCDDADASNNPGAEESCDGDDDDCDGQVDEDDAYDVVTWYADADGDGYGDATATDVACDQPTGFVATSGDCDDTAAAVNPAASESCNSEDDDCDGETDEDATDGITWYADSDADTYGDASATKVACTQPSGYVATSTDCDDGSASAHPGGTEVCDADDTDEDCDGLADDDDPGVTGQSTWYLDADGDGYGLSTSSKSACDAGSGYVADATDCDDGDASTNPGASEVCGGGDEDCDGTTDEDGASDVTTWYADSDGDGYGDASNSDVDCDQPPGMVATAGDCDDTAAAVNPAATETCNLEDDDCDGSTDESDASDAITWYKDADGDGWGLETSSTTACTQPSGYVADSGDCNDGNAGVSPDAAEVCDAADTDEDCDGTTDDNDSSVTGQSTAYADADGDDYGDPNTSKLTCELSASWVLDSSDCDDTDATINPDGTEVCDAADADEDCDGLADSADPSATGSNTFWPDTDADGYGDPDGATTAACDPPAGYAENDEDCDDADATVSPAATEVCNNGLDDDCDGTANSCSLDGTYDYTDADYVWLGDSAGEYLGGAVAFLGDQDNDGDDEILLGGYGYKYLTFSASGRVLLMDGPADADSETDGYTIGGAAASDYFGWDIAGLGDTNVDGYDDFVASAYLSDPSGRSAAGSVYVFQSPVSAGGVTAEAYMTVIGGATSDNAGYSVSSGGDFDGDGTNDVLIGVPNLDTGATNGGGAALFTTITSGTVNVANADWLWTGTASSDYLGTSVGGGGDINGDGLDDVVLGAYAVGSTNTGVAYLLYGDSGAGAVTPIVDADVKINGTRSSGRLGIAVAVVGDIQDDGYDDMLIGEDCSGATGCGGHAYLVSGSNALASTIPSASANADFAGSTNGDYIGQTVAKAGDVDADGYDEVYFAGPGVDDGSTSGVGSVYLFYGGTSLTGTLGVGTADAIFSGTATSDAFGDDIAGGGDNDGDGYDDLLMGSPSIDDGSSSATGGAVLFYGGGM
jgi:hypothetical protein